MGNLPLFTGCPPSGERGLIEEKTFFTYEKSSIYDAMDSVNSDAIVS